MEVLDEGVRQLPRRRVCRICGQHHTAHEPHVYDYVEEVDEDVTCHICLQPLVTPVDTPCGHTFCKPCLLSFLKVQQSCPIDRKPLSQQLCSLSSLVLKKLLEKLIVKCPNTEQCEHTLPRGDLEDHLKYRCPGNWVACSYSAAGCDFRGPPRSVSTHSSTCSFKDHGVQRSSIVEGEPSYIEIPRTQTALGIAIVGGADTPLRCIVIQEVFPDGLIAQDGRLQAGDQIIEIDGKPMTSSTHHQVCQILRRSPPVLRLGIYREKIDAYRTPSGRSSTVSSPVNVPPIVQPPPLPVQPPPLPVQHSAGPPQSTVDAGVLLEESSVDQNYRNTSSPDYIKFDEGADEQMLVHVTLVRESERQLGIKLGGRRTEPGIFIMELMTGSVAEQDGRLQAHDRILAINGNDVRYARLDYAFRLITQSVGQISLIVSRTPYFKGEYDHLFKRPNPELVVSHSRAKSAPDRLVEQKRNNDHQDYTELSGKVYGVDTTDGFENGQTDKSASCESLAENSSHLPGNRQLSSRFQSNGSFVNNKFIQCTSIGSFGELDPTSHNYSLGSITSALNKSNGSLTQHNSSRHIIEEDPSALNDYSPPALPPRSRLPLGRTSSYDQLEEDPELNNNFDQDKVLGGGLPASGCADVVDGPIHSRLKSRRSRENREVGEITVLVKKALKIEGNQLPQKTVTISKDAAESLGMRIGGGVNSNEGDIPIYIANIHPQGPVGKSKQVKKGDILLSVNGNTLLGLTHTQAVFLLKATAELAGVTLSLLDGPETFSGPANFVPSWLFWQKLPKALHISKTVVLHRTQRASLGFSIVGGNDPERGPEPIHVLFVVSTSPAAINGRLRCGDRILTVDGHNLENVSHATAVCLLKQAGQRVTLEVVSWMGTEL